MKIYITRHGETTWNVEDRVCGRPDVPLTEKGRRQAMELAERVKGKGITRMLVSPLSRARETARLANTYIQVPVETEPRLIEHSFGRLEGETEHDHQVSRRGVRAGGGASDLQSAG